MSSEGMRITHIRLLQCDFSNVCVMKLKAHANSVFLIDYKNRAFISTFFHEICPLLYLLLTDLDGLCEFFEVRVRVYYLENIQQNISLTVVYCCLQ